MKVQIRTGRRYSSLFQNQTTFPNLFLQGIKNTSKNDATAPALSNNIDEQETAIIRQIQKHYICDEHEKKACYVKTSHGGHYHFTTGDLSAWATLIVGRFIVPL